MTNKWLGDDISFFTPRISRKDPTARSRVVGSLGVCPHFCDTLGNLPLFFGGWSLGGAFCITEIVIWLRLKKPAPKWNLGKWKHGPKPAVCPSCLILSFLYHINSHNPTARVSTSQFPVACPSSKNPDPPIDFRVFFRAAWVGTWTPQNQNAGETCKR